MVRGVVEGASKRGGAGLNRMQMTQAMVVTELQYHQQVNNEFGEYPIGNGLSKRKQLSDHRLSLRS
jgi:hypothetical protein